MVALRFFLIAIGTTVSLLLVTVVAFGMLWLRQRGPQDQDCSPIGFTRHLLQTRKDFVFKKLKHVREYSQWASAEA